MIARLAFFIFTLMQLTLPVRSAELCNEAIPLPSIDPVFEDIHDHLEKHSASDEQVMNAFCKTKTPPSMIEMNKFIQSKAIGEKVNNSFHQVDFEGESLAMLKAFEDLTTMYNSLGNMPWPDKQVPIQEKFQINPECKKVNCAIEKIWGKEMGTKILFMYLKYGFNGSELAFTHSARFEMEELDDVLMALGDVPAHFQPLGNEKNQRLNHMNFKADEENSKVIANAGIQLFDLWTKQTRPKRQYAVYHELAHNMNYPLKMMDNSPEWLAMSGWVLKGQDWEYNSEKSCVTSKYAATNPSEDWAEALTSYRYSPQILKKECPQKYEFVKQKVYKGKEYTSAAACR
jgi:hypothetical protein